MRFTPAILAALASVCIAAPSPVPDNPPNLNDNPPDDHWAVVIYHDINKRGDGVRLQAPLGHCQNTPFNMVLSVDLLKSKECYIFDAWDCPLGEERRPRRFRLDLDAQNLNSVDNGMNQFANNVYSVLCNQHTDSDGNPPQ